MSTYFVPFALFLFLGSLTAHAQSKHVMSGYVTDKHTGEALIGATIRVLPDGNGVISNTFGYYSIQVPTGEQQLICSYVGSKADTLKLTINADIRRNFNLAPGKLLDAVDVTGITASADKQNDISRINIPMQQIEKLPSIMGEKDILKAIQLLPGVQAGTEGTTGLYVRGGGPDQNMILLDGVPVYNVSHLFGFFSVFTPEAISNVDLYKGGFPARYAGRVSSVIDIQMKEGSLKSWKGAYTIGLLSAKAMVEGPLKKDVSSIMIAARRSYFDALMKPMLTSSDPDGAKSSMGYHFQDLNIKTNYKLSEKDRLYLSFYSGLDQYNAKVTSQLDDNDKQFSSRNKASFGWGNATSALRYNRVITPRLFANFTLNYSKYRYALKTSTLNNESYTTTPDQNTQEYFNYDYFSNIRDWLVKGDFDYYHSTIHQWKFGGDMIFHRFEPGRLVSLVKSRKEPTAASEIKGSQPLLATEANLYAEDNIRINDDLEINAGLHYTGYHINNKTFHSLQPRITGRYSLNDKWSLKFAYANMSQPLHLLTNSGIGLPTDLWVPATDKVPPQRSNQYTLGLSTTPWTGIELGIEAYWKTMSHVIDYKEGANFTNTAIDWQDKVEIGKGRSKGIELFMQKKAGFLTGWVGYTLSWTDRQFDNINNGRYFPYKYDRRHDLKVVLIGSLTDNIELTGSWQFGTGNVLTLPVASYPVADNSYLQYPYTYDMFNTANPNIVEYMPERNNYRMKPFHKMDIGINFIKEKERGTRIWSFDIYNVYARQNPLFYYYKTEMDGTRKLKQVSLLPIIPSVSFTFKFK